MMCYSQRPCSIRECAAKMVVVYMSGRLRQKLAMVLEILLMHQVQDISHIIALQYHGRIAFSSTNSLRIYYWVGLLHLKLNIHPLWRIYQKSSTGECDFLMDGMMNNSIWNWLPFILFQSNTNNDIFCNELLYQNLKIYKFSLLVNLGEGERFSHRLTWGDPYGLKLMKIWRFHQEK